ncbi:DNA-binding GntR family transcriptional regulator [Variovorax boronicumulans]|uniref:GntR family transcriptional regulator n=1 Tax=Variovorax boronicumulans TaxID=436515 RepID=UPI0027808A4F|nr:GntR family transcriptional regulator [Variovorax boronicumulans]MDP9995730.1 DNA-binding GntR family transcriptional regulator [Variovorax boronicumulans]MDQ0006805.1 DNA-binding GntR family transcriptional regulator [Variovorax boronicumulans]MDQ0036752.1 DNA-binding GntR family transcriptional regulator [Variovorax boronicumulans]MDQ0044568.1 DNA-binding GntR family transcriptional regulator [Variovorax boronicumulans]
MISANSEIPVVERIRYAILDGTWPPGQRLGPLALAEQLDTSSTVVREALTRLAGESLLEAKVNRGFFVPELDLQEFRDVTELRCVTEALALRLSIERGDLQWETTLLAAHHRMQKTPRRLPDCNRVNDEWRRAHWGFHHALLAACGCEPMLKIAASLAQSTDLYRAWAAPAREASKRNVEHEHQDLIEAALSRDAETAIALLCQHYRETARVVLDAGLIAKAEVKGK